MARNNNPRPDPAEMTFEQSLRELETIVAAMEQGEVPLAQSLEQFERGMAMIKRCEGLLSQAEKKIELLTETPKGAPATAPLPPVEPDGQ